MEDFGVGAYLFMLFVKTRLTGTHFTIGLLFLFLDAMALSGMSATRRSSPAPPSSGRVALQASMAVFLVAILYISIIASKRWGVREGIYREMSVIDVSGPLIGPSYWRHSSDTSWFPVDADRRRALEGGVADAEDHVHILFPARHAVAHVLLV